MSLTLERPVVLIPLKVVNTTACDICGLACTHGTCCTKYCKQCEA